MIPIPLNLFARRGVQFQYTFRIVNFFDNVNSARFLLYNNPPTGPKVLFMQRTQANGGLIYQSDIITVTIPANEVSQLVAGNRYWYELMLNVNLNPCAGRFNVLEAV